MGDSFTYGYGQDDEYTLPRLVEKGLSRQFDGIEVINAGFHGSNPMQYDLYLRKEGFSLKPDIIVLVILADNDLIDIDYNFVEKYGPDGLPEKIVDGYTSYKGSRYFAYIPGFFYRIPILERSVVWYKFMQKLSNYQKHTYFKKPTYSYKVFEEFFDRSILRIIKSSKQNGITLIPWIIIGRDTYFQKPMESQQYKYIRDFFQKHNAKYLDLGNEISKYVPRQMFYVALNGSLDMHLSEFGNQVAAQAGIVYLTPIIENLTEK